MNAYALTWLQIRFELRTLLRNRSALVFTAAFPLVFLVVFGYLNATGTTEFRGKMVDTIQFFVPGILAFGVIGACYTNLAIRTTLLRDNGVMKRVKGTPLPRASYLGGLIGSSVLFGVFMAILTFVMAELLYNISFDARHIPAFLLALFVGSASFCAIGVAVASLIPNGDAGPGIVNFVLFPILFISDVFYSVAALPTWLSFIASVFPIKHFANALQETFNASAASWGFSWLDIAVLIAWGAGATLVAVKNFSWESRKAG